ncbi:MAG TPA: carboxypeptidase-like regulatory domain-containing protein, partial [Planctomycetota bacterium]|nr:carboxypeptidase-like regulatory domain-containing protein [Planctomycetota bacterium]
LRLLLLPAHAVEGRVVRADGKPIEGALVSLMATGGRGSRPAEAAARSDASGAFRLEDVRPGRYMAMATLPGGATQATPREVVVPGAGTVEMALDDGSSARVRVADDATGAAVADARVGIQVVSPGPPPAFGLVFGRTGADGALLVAGLPAGQAQRVVVRAPGCLPFPGPKDGTAFAGSALAPGKPLEAIVRLRKGATLRGRVTDTAGKPVPKAEVWFAWSESTANMVTLYRSDPVATDAAGAYSIPSAGRGTGIAVVRAEGFVLPDLPPDLTRALSGSGIPEPLRVALPESGEVAKDLVLAPCSNLEGVVVDADGKPVAGAAVSLDRPAVEPTSRWMEPPAAPPVWTDAAGRFRLVGLAPGEAAVLAVHGPRGLFGRAGPAAVAPGGAATLRVEVAPGALLAGSVVREDGTPVPGAVLRVGAGGVEKGMEMFREKVLAALEGDAEAHPVGADGAFRVAGLAPGQYALFAAADGCTPARGVEVVLAAGEARGDLRLVLGGERFLAGRVVDEGGAPVAGARIFVQDLEQARIDPTGTAAGETDAEGRFRVPGLTAPRYRVRAEASGSPAESGEGAPGGPEVVLRLRKGLAIAGVVVDAETGKPLAAIPVRAEFLRARSMNDREGGSATTGPDGSFRMEGLRAGPWRVVAGDTQGASPYAAELLASVEAGTVDLRISLRKGAAISGRVLDEQGKPISSRVVVSAQRLGPDGKPEPGQANRSVPVGSDGAFRLDGLVPGRYSLFFSPMMGPGSPG